MEHRAYAALRVASIVSLAASSQRANAQQPSTSPTASRLHVEAADSIVLQRTGCLGSCPFYRLRITRQGAVLFQLRDFLGNTSRTYTARLDSSEVGSLLTDARLIGFSELPDTIASIQAYCHVRWTDAPTAIVTLFGASWSKQVVDYHGCWWAPEALRRFEDEVDSTAHAQRWLPRH